MLAASGVAADRIRTCRQPKGITQHRPITPVHILDPAGVRARLLCRSRMTDLVTSLEPKLLSAVFGMRPEGVMI